MKTREEIIRENEFFIDKPTLANQIIAYENKNKDFLPNNFEIAIKQNYRVANRDIAIGRFHKFYFFAIDKENAGWVYQMFENENYFKNFFVNLPGMEEEDIAFWFQEIKKLK